MFKRLRNNMLLFNMVTVFIVIAVAFSIIYLVTYGNIERSNERKLQSMSNVALPGNPVNIAGERLMGDPPERFSADYTVSFALFVSNGEVQAISSHLDFDTKVYVDAYKKIGSNKSGKISFENKRWMYASAPLILPVQTMGGAVFSAETNFERIVFLDVSDGVQTLRDLLLTLSLVGVAVLVALFLFSYRFAARAVRPIEESYLKQKQFVEDASHELRTPLAIISSNVDAIETNTEESVGSQSEWFFYIKEELKRTGKLVDDLLYLAKVENTRPEGDLPFDFSLSCETACASVDASLYDKGISLNTKIEKNIYVAADSEKIMQVIYILLDNAGKYTPKGGTVEFTLNSEKDNAVVHLTNTGDGIATGELTKIFDRFYRPDTSRSQETGGAGLGLSIAKTIVERAGGVIYAESAGGYTRFTFCLKAFKN